MLMDNCDSLAYNQKELERTYVSTAGTGKINYNMMDYRVIFKNGIPMAVGENLL